MHQRVDIEEIEEFVGESSEFHVSVLLEYLELILAVYERSVVHVSFLFGYLELMIYDEIVSHVHVSVSDCCSDVGLSWKKMSIKLCSD